MKKKPLLKIVISLIVILGIFFSLFISFTSATRRAIIQPAGLHYFLLPGTTPRKFIRDLQTQAELRDPTLFLLLLKQHPGRKIQTGEYFFPGNSSAEQVVNQVLNGKVMRHSFTIIDGWTIYQVINALQQAPVLKHTLINPTPASVAKAMNIPYGTPEGLLFPETYYYTWNTSDITLLNRAYVDMQRFLTEAWAQRDRNTPYGSPYQALIVASMIEKETAQPKEMPMIATVILKRLAAKMLLQIDSTVIYGMLPNYPGKLTHDDLHTKTIYNTYTQLGLPPTPISMPSAMAILATLHPVFTPAWYFVAKGDGTHVFSMTLDQHNQAVNQYQKSQPLGKVNP